VVRTVLALAATSAVLAGCGLAPHVSPATTQTGSALANAQTTHEYSPTHPPRQRASTSAPSATDAIRAFAAAYINWNAHTVVAVMRTLAAASIGQARSAMQLAAAGAARDYELQRGGIANSGTVEAVAPLAGSRDEYVVVTQERTTAANTTAYQGLRPAWHLTIATVTRVGGGGWVLSGWQPES
jgi:hypothetical protein